MIKVLFLLRSLDYGGAERQLVTLARGMNRQRFDISVLTFYSGGDLVGDLHIAGVQVLAVGKSGRWDIKGFLVRLLELVQQLQPEVVYAFLPVPNILAGMLKLLKPKLQVIYGVRTSGKDLSHYDWTFALSFWLERLLAGKADAVVANSFAGRDHYTKQGFRAKKIHVIPNGIDTEQFQPQPQKCGGLFKEWGLGAQNRLVGLPARLDPVKGHRVFIKAIMKIVEHHPEVRFLIIGDGPDSYREELVNQAKSLGVDQYIFWSKARQDMPAVYSSLCVCCSASLFSEGFSNVIGEAMSCGLPCVVTNVGDMPLEVGDTGEVVPAGDADKLAEAIIRVLALDPGERAKLGARARNRILQEYTVKKMVAKTEELISTLIEC
jgi:glycosyltransferase involved in cell wall biosynthesis